MPTPFSATMLLAELPRLRRYARILTDDPERADRLVEETLSRARQLRDESAAEARGTLLGLLREVNARHTAATSTSGAIAPAAPAADSPPKTDPEPGREIGQPRSDRGAAMLAQLRALPLDQREVLVLVAVERMSYQEIAALTHAPVATIISRLSQARETLRASSSKPLSAPGAN